MKKLHALSAFAFVFVALAAIPQAALADGGMFIPPDYTKHVYAPSQKAVIIWDGTKETMILSTTETIHGKKIVKQLGLVRGNTIRARHIGRDIMAILRHIVGGEITDYTKMMAESREQAIDRMIEDAQKLGANAIVSINFTTQMVMGGASEILAYGTAVVVE